MEPAADRRMGNLLPARHVLLRAVDGYGRDGSGIRPGSKTDGTPCCRPRACRGSVVVPRVAETELAGTAHSVYSARRWVFGLWSCR